MFEPIGLNSIDVEEVTRIGVGPGCYRRDLPSREGARMWIVEMEPGAVWPHVDHHDLRGEDVYVFEGTMIEGEQRFGAGTFIHFDAHSSHRPRTDAGVRLFGVNLL